MGFFNFFKQLSFLSPKNARQALLSLPDRTKSKKAPLLRYFSLPFGAVVETIGIEPTTS